MASSKITDEVFWHDVDHTYSASEFLKAATRGTGWWTRRNHHGASPVMHTFERGALDQTLPHMFKKAWLAGDRFDCEDAQGRTLWAYVFRHGCGNRPNPIVFSDQPNLYVLELLHQARPSMRNAQGDGLLVQVMGGEEDSWCLARSRVLTYALQTPQMPHRFGWEDWLAGAPEAQQRVGLRLFDTLDSHSLAGNSSSNKLEGTAQVLIDWWKPLLQSNAAPGAMAPALEAAIGLIGLLERGVRTGSSPGEAVGQLRRRKKLDALTATLVQHAPHHWWDSGALETWAQGSQKAQAWAQSTVSAGRAQRLEQELPTAAPMSKGPRL